MDEFDIYESRTTADLADQCFGILPKDGQWKNTITYNRLTRTVTLPNKLTRSIRAPTRLTNAEWF